MIPVLLQSESPWQRNDAIPFYLSLCFSVLGKLLWAIASLKNFINLHSAALIVTVFAFNLVHAYKFRIIQKTAQEFFFIHLTISSSIVNKCTLQVSSTL